MVYPTTFEQKIGFDQIRNLVSQRCISPLGLKFVQKIRMSTKIDTIRMMLEQVEEMRQIMLFDSHFPAQDYFDLGEEIALLKLEGSHIDTESLARLKSMLKTIEQIIGYVRKRETEKYPHLIALVDHLNFDPTLIPMLDRIVDDKGNIRDNASPELHQIRRSIGQLTQNAAKKIRQILRSSKQESIVADDAEITIRNGRLVIPVPAAFKRKLRGFIHDESATGQTVFIEPEAVFDDNNEIRDLQNAERREIIRILIEVSDALRPTLGDIESMQLFLGLIDFLRAKAKLAIEILAVKPIINEFASIEWKKAIHPLLYLNFKPQKKTVVAQDITLTQKERILIISGPNAGGKSVTLKTVGLIQYMFQCGFLVPVNELSEFGVFKSIFLDMGDEQSIDNDLSTYSSHLKNMMVMISESNRQSLFLIDEFGTGTEPTLGGAMAEAVLEKLIANQSFGIVTTHFGNLKLVADQHPEVKNAAMLFDIEEMKPLYILKIGKPGSSFTFEIAKKIGFPETVLEHARQITGYDRIDYEQRLQQLETELYTITEQKKQLNSADETLAELIERYNNKNSELEQLRREAIHEAKAEAREIVKSANKIIENTIFEIRQSQADKEKVKTIRKKVEDFTQTLAEEPAPKSISKKKTDTKETPKPINPELLKPLAKGDNVLLLGMDAKAEVIDLKGDEVTVSLNGVIFRTELRKVEKISRSESKKISRNPNAAQSVYQRMIEKSTTFKTTLDLRGKRAEEALTETERLIDDAILLSIKELRILHGKGNGILRQLIRKQLSTNDNVAKFYDEKIEFGGDGITVVELK
jgi:DNA mismatch repair protein MutS2